jgi:DNA-binding SARP family transcriptional activator
MDGAPTAYVNLLDGFTLRLAEAGCCTAEDMPRGLQRLVAYLCLTPSMSRDAAVGRLWPDVPEARAHGSLRSALWRLQKVAPGLVTGTRETLSLSEGVQVDVRELVAWTRRAMDPDTPVDAVVPGYDAMSGELLPGWYDDWVLLERERLRQLWLHALEAWAEKLIAAGRFGGATQAAYGAVSIEPLRESAHRILVRVHLAEGNLAEAVRVFESFRAFLSEELGVPPSASMQQLVRDLPRYWPDATPAQHRLSVAPRRRPDVDRGSAASDRA